MEESIVRKIRHALEGPLDSECKVVYILAESRKLLDSARHDHGSFALRLYCNWALHVDLDFPATTLPFLRIVEKYAKSVLDGCKDIVEENRMLGEFAFLESFRREFEEFLRSHRLPTDVCTDRKRWHEFLTYYSGVIEDGSIFCKAQTDELKLVRGVVFKKGREVPGYHLPFGLIWTIIFRDGRKVEVEVKASSPQGHDMILFGLKLALQDRN